MVNSAVYPGLERKPGGPDNWVEKAGGLPSYIERIAKHLHYERGYSISRAIATAVNTVKRWARMGKVAKYGDPNHKHVSAKTAALAAKAVAEWEAKKRAGSLNLSDVEEFIISRTELTDKFVLDLAEETSYLRDQKCKYCAAPASMSVLHSEGMAYVPCCDNHLGQAKADAASSTPDGTSDPDNINGVYSIKAGKKVDLADGTGAEFAARAILSAMDIKALAKRANSIEDPEQKAAARTRILDLAGIDAAEVIDLASTIAPRNARGRASDGRRSYKGQGKWKHGFVPANKAAKEAKAKGSPIAIKRLNRLFGGDKAPDDPQKSTREAPRGSRKAPAGRRAPSTSSKSRAFREKDAKNIKIDEKGVTERANSIGQLRSSQFVDSRETKHSSPSNRKEASKQSRAPRRAEQDWDSIPANLKTTRNGKRYVVATFGGKQVITEWTGGVNEVEQAALNKRKVQTSITTGDAQSMSTAELRQLLKNPNTPKSVRKILNRALLQKDPEAKG